MFWLILFLAVTSFFFVFNVFFFVAVYLYYERKRQWFIETLNVVQKELAPQTFRDRVQKRECCIICKGNVPHKPSAFPPVVSLHGACLERLQANEVIVKRVGGRLEEGRVNLKNELLSSFTFDNKKVIENKKS